MRESVQQQTLIAHLVKDVPGIIAIYRFGSQVRGTARSGSDVDLAILALRPIPPRQRFDLAQDLAVLVKQDVDLVDLRSASTVMRMQVVSTGKCIHGADEPERRRFEMLVYSDYARLNEERRDILRQIREEGRVYG
jgi:predicted nucleotidyltransferase